MIYKRIIIISLATMFVLSFLFSILYMRPYHRVKIKGHVILVNPSAKPDPTKDYHLVLWDYDWPLAKSDYREHLQKAIRKYQKSNPRIGVTVKLIHGFEGPAQLKEALQKGHPPDLYCSAGEIPEFDFERQIPVSPYLESSGKSGSYLPWAKELSRINGVMCCFPRWLRIPLWMGNRTLMRQNGLNVKAIRQNGWSWGELTSKGVTGPKGFFPVVGAIFPDLLLKQKTGWESKPNWEWTERIRSTCKVPKDFYHNALGHFMAGQAMTLAGVTPLLAKRIQENLKSQGSGLEAVCLPPPYVEAGLFSLPVDFGVICLYRQHRYGGDDRVAAALRLGEYLSLERGAFPWEELMVMPTGCTTAQWLQEENARGNDIAMMAETVTHFKVSPRKTWEWSSRGNGDILERYMSGRLSREAAMLLMKKAANQSKRQGLSPHSAAFKAGVDGWLSKILNIKR